MTMSDHFRMVYDRSERGTELRKRHQYRKIRQVGGEVEYEYEYQQCNEADCSCHTELCSLSTKSTS